MSLSEPEALLALQALDVDAEHLRYRRSTLAELDTAQRARADVVEWERRHTQLGARLAELDRSVSDAEAQSTSIDAHSARLESQLRTFIAPREAEALQRELRSLADRRSELDDAGLAALEEQAMLDDEMTAHLAAESALRESQQSADSALAAAWADIDAELEVIAQRRIEAVAGLPEQLLARYEGLRAHHGVAVVRFTGRRCDGCHLDLSPAEVDSVREAPEGQFAECPQCGRLLVR